MAHQSREHAGGTRGAGTGRAQPGSGLAGHLAASGSDLSRQLERVLERIDSLPTLSSVAQRVIALATADDADMRQIAQIIESDPSLTAKILALCKRADRGLSSQIVSVERAVVLLGFEAVRAATLSVEVFDLLNTRKTPEPHDPSERPAFDRASYWRFCVGVACAAELLASESRRPGSPRPTEAFTCGLLHGVGLIALDMVIPKTLARVVELAERKRIGVAEASRAVIGFDHHTAGKRLAERWGLPRVLQDVLWLHGLPPEGAVETPSRGVIGVVDAAIAITKRMHIGWGADYSPPVEPASVCASCGVAQASVERVASRLHERVADRVSILGLDETPAERLMLESLSRANAALDRARVQSASRAGGADSMARALQSIASLHAAPAEELRGESLAAAIARSAAVALGASDTVVIFTHDKTCAEAHPGQWLSARHCVAMSPPGRMLELRAGAPSEVERALLSARADSGAMECECAAVAARALDDPGGARVIPLHGRRAVGMIVYTPGPGADPGGEGLARAALDGLAAWWGGLLDAEADRAEAASLQERVVDASRRLAEAQAKIVEAESLVRLAEVAAGAAHEMNNPLTVISGRAQQLAQTAKEPRERAVAEAIDSAAQKLSDLVTSLRLYADPPKPRPAPVALREALDRATRLGAEKARVAGAQKPTVRVLVEHLPGMPVLDGVQLTEAVSELIANAMESEGCAAVIVRASSEAPDGRLVIAVSDDGAGLSEKALRHAFDPFFSEKKAGRQQGLGLARARRLLGLNGADLLLRNREEGGCVASVVFAEVGRIFPGRSHQSAA